MNEFSCISYWTWVADPGIFRKNDDQFFGMSAEFERKISLTSITHKKKNSAVEIAAGFINLVGAALAKW